MQSRKLKNLSNFLRYSHWKWWRVPNKWAHGLVLERTATKLLDKLYCEYTRNPYYFQFSNAYLLIGISWSVLEIWLKVWTQNGENDKIYIFTSSSKTVPKNTLKLGVLESWDQMLKTYYHYRKCVLNFFL